MASVKVQKLFGQHYLDLFIEYLNAVLDIHDCIKTQKRSKK